MVRSTVDSESRAPAISSSSSAPFSKLSATAPASVATRSRAGVRSRVVRPASRSKGNRPLPQTPAEVVGAAVADGPHEAEGGVRAVRVELGRPGRSAGRSPRRLRSRFFPARCCSTALAAILWAIARIWNSFCPKRWASSVEARLAASSLISASTASRMAWARSLIRLPSPAAGVRTAWVDSGSSARFSSAVAIFALVYKDSTNFRAAHRFWWQSSTHVLTIARTIVIIKSSKRTNGRSLC